MFDKKKMIGLLHDMAVLCINRPNYYTEDIYMTAEGYTNMIKANRFRENNLDDLIKFLEDISNQIGTKDYKKSIDGFKKIKKEMHDGNVTITEMNQDSFIKKYKGKKLVLGDYPGSGYTDCDLDFDEHEYLFEYFENIDDKEYLIKYTIHANENNLIEDISIVVYDYESEEYVKATDKVYFSVDSRLDLFV